MKKKQPPKASKARTARPAVRKKAKAAAKRVRKVAAPAPAPAAMPTGMIEAAVAPPPAGDPAQLRLETSCTLREASDLHFSMLAVRQDAQVFSIDGSAVERVDTAGLQLLACFARARVAAGGTISWTAVSPELARCASRLGMEEVLGMPSTGAGDTP